MFPALLFSPRADAASVRPHVCRGRPSPWTAPGGRLSYSRVPARHRGALGIWLRHEALRHEVLRLLGQVSAARPARAQGFPPSPAVLSGTRGPPTHAKTPAPLL